MKKILIALALSLTASVSNAQMIYGNTFPYWNVTGPLVVGGTTTLTGGIVGTATNDSATAGNIGEFKTTTVVAGSAIAGAGTGAFKDVTSVSLTAGDWIVSGTCDYVWTGVTATIMNCGLGTTADTMAGQAGGAGIGTDPASIRQGTIGTTLTGTQTLSAPPTRVSIAATTTIRLVAGMTYSAGSFTQYGTIKAWRIR